MIWLKGNLGAISYLDCLKSYSLTLIGLTMGIFLLLINFFCSLFSTVLFFECPVVASKKPLNILKHHYIISM